MRAGKGTNIRKLSEQKLQAELNHLDTGESPEAALKPTFERPAIEKFVGDVVIKAFSIKIGLNDDLFAFGLDSLKSTEIVRGLKGGLKRLLSLLPIFRNLIALQ